MEPISPLTRFYQSDTLSENPPYMMCSRRFRCFWGTPHPQKQQNPLSGRSIATPEGRRGPRKGGAKGSKSPDNHSKSRFCHFYDFSQLFEKSQNFQQKKVICSWILIGTGMRRTARSLREPRSHHQTLVLRKNGEKK